MLGEPYSFTGQTVDMRGLKQFLAVTTQVSVAQVVGQNIDDIGLLFDPGGRNLWLRSPGQLWPEPEKPTEMLSYINRFVLKIAFFLFCAKDTQNYDELIISMIFFWSGFVASLKVDPATLELGNYSTEFRLHTLF